MNMKEAMKQRHMVRKYTDQKLSKEDIQKINNRLEEINQKHNLSMKLMVNNSEGVNAIFKLILARGVQNYIILAGDNKDSLGEDLGYFGADIMLYAQTLGLNTWWVGGTYNRSVAQFVNNKKVIGIIAIGYGQTQGVQHKLRSPNDVSLYDGEMPQWFVDGVEAALLAPTALNKQDFMVTGHNNKVKIECSKSIFAEANLGLVKYHFELGAGKNNFMWKE